ncbi:M4 family metallopeptidase [Brochothrix campestris]|uniref:Neutral metalloproteinase n=1 Tax=Brochothrix campestris FSL F6-1037 TaxID=1265861 RepID=W7CH42_9LIST|nr:M4 family metallopeptidase [Brochothrix campestris]EUJ38729.1 NprE [Brochothrix campestris FSL F6-1037]
MKHRDIQVKSKKILATILLTTTFFTVGFSTMTASADINPDTVKAEELEKKLPQLMGGEIDSKILEQYNVIGKVSDDNGFTHYVMQQMVNAIPAENGELHVHVNKDNIITSVTGDVNEKEIHLNGKITVDETKAQDIAKAAFGAEDGFVYQIKQYATTDGIAYWQVSVGSKEGSETATVYKVDAMNGTIIETYKANHDVANISGKASTGIGKTTAGKDVTFPTLVDQQGTHYMQDSPADDAKNTVLDILSVKKDARNNKLYSVGIINSINGQFTDRGAVDAYINGRAVYNYYKNNFNFRGVDGKKQQIVSMVNDSSSPSNAFWDPSSQTMKYGARNGLSLAAAMDIVGHETTHGVINNSSNLDYKGQSGALNESLADTFGHFMDNKDWTMGEDIGWILRDFEHPTNHNQPDHMNNFQNLPETNDQGGVHINSGIMNKAAYNVINAIGQEKAQQIFFTVMRHYLNHASDFNQMKEAMVQASHDLYPNEPQVAVEVNNAYANVGLGEIINNIKQSNILPEQQIEVTQTDNVTSIEFSEESGTLPTIYGQKEEKNKKTVSLKIKKNSKNQVQYLIC